MEMATQTPAIARGRCDAASRLVAADEPLASLQRACGGEVPGTVAIPELLELVSQAAQFGRKLARTLHAVDETSAISVWAEVAPDAEGCALALSNWRAVPLAPSDEAVLADEQPVVALLAELHARLDGRQRVLAIGRAVAPLEGIAAAMRDATSKAWTDFVVVAGSSHRQPLHWRLLDGAEIGVEGIDGRWRARLFPQPVTGGPVGGFDLYLVPSALDEIPHPDAEGTQVEPSNALDGLLGRDLAPVLRQPINRIIANAETIRTRLAGPLADDYTAYAGDIADAARHLLGLVEDLGDLEAIESPGFAPTIEPIDLAEAARRAVGILGVRAQERRIVVEAPATDRTMPALGEYRRVLQILLNLLGNALRYSPEGSKVQVRVEGRGDRAAVVVADEGAGLSMPQQARVFDKFERLGRKGDGGSGLGLYISRRLARAMRGELSVESQPGEGARFTLELPAGE